MKTIIYLIQVSACTGVFYIFYHLVLRRLTFFTINRWYLLGTLLLSFTIPLITLPAESVPQVYSLAPSFSEITEFSNAAKEGHLQEQQTLSSIPVQTPVLPPFDWVSLLPVLYVLVVAMLFLYLIASLLTLYRKTRSGMLFSIGNVRVMKATAPVKNSSFLNYIFINDEELSRDEMEQVVSHELIHVEQLHSVDKILVRMARIALWFNPFVYAYSNAVEANHEYQVDSRLAENADKEAYVRLLLRLAVPGNSISNQFSKFPLSKRIAMIFSKPSKNMKKLIYTLSLPLVVFSCLAFANREPNAPSISSVSKTVEFQTMKQVKDDLKDKHGGTITKEETAKPVNQQMSLITPDPGTLQATPDIIVPDSFTPYDSDGKDDLLKITVVNKDIKIESLKIYDKQHNVVFKTSDITKPWNGFKDNVIPRNFAPNLRENNLNNVVLLSAFGTEILPMGTPINYFWLIEGKDASNKSASWIGYVTVK